jgi:hypothetical protein
MKTFRRILYFGIASIMAITVATLFIPWLSSLGIYPGRGLAPFSSPAGMMVWCAGFVKVEPSLTRAGIISVMLFFLICFTATP